MTALTASAPTGTELLMTFYGDDFTGSTDVMETLEDAGVPTVLFLAPPTAEQVAAHPEARAIGVAGISRTMTPAQMDAQLPEILDGLAELGAPIFHYKICSTFDSSPAVGSIGHAAELVRRRFPGTAMPLVIGVPQLGRWTAFGTLFAAFRGAVYRLDRHPTMTEHPMTPMHESDLRRHLTAQTDLPLDLVDIRQLDGDDPEVDQRVDTALADAEGIVVLDVDDLASQRQVGRALDRLIARARAAERPVAVIGSSGVQYALAAAWGASGIAAALPVRPATQTLVIAGSRGPATAAQVAEARRHGFAEVTVDAVAVTRDATASAAQDDVARRAVAALAGGGHVLVSTPPKGGTPVDGTALATALGAIARRIADAADIPRLVVAGGDTSGLVARALGVTALRLVRRLAPGAPLCRAVSDDPRIDGLELCLKAGQIGGPDYLIHLAGLGTEPTARQPPERNTRS
jgi:uncharacterized protein YgbK (DUF1537 family)